MSEVPEIAYPEWTEYRKKNGLDPLGLQNTSVGIYQKLIPGISNVTLRVRYYGFYAWLAAVYTERTRDTDPKAWQRFIRRAEALYALTSQRQGNEYGVRSAPRRRLREYRRARDRRATDRFLDRARPSR